MSIKLSIVVPVYNVEKYIARCLDSLLSQNIDYDEYEIIIVNDGTPDNAIDIVREYQSRYPNIKLVEKSNGGLSSARNFGFKHCIGKYVWMVDSDDTIQSNCLKDVLDYAIKNDIDFLSFPMNDRYPDGRVNLSNIQYKPANKIVSNTEYLSSYKVEFSACCFLVKASIIQDNGISFIEGITQEDIDFVLRLLEYCPRVSSFQDLGGLYNYYTGRQGSITTVMNRAKYLKTLESFYVAINSIQGKFKDESNNPNSYSFFVQPHINNMKCYALTYLLYFPLPLEYRMKFFDKYYQAGFFNIGPTSFLSPKVKSISFIFKSVSMYKIALGFLGTFNKGNK